MSVQTSPNIAEKIAKLRFDIAKLQKDFDFFQGSLAGNIAFAARIGIAFIAENTVKFEFEFNRLISNPLGSKKFQLSQLLQVQKDRGQQDIPPPQQVTTQPKDEIQFLSTPKDTFDIIGVQGSVVPPSDLAKGITDVLGSERLPTGILVLKMEQTRFPQVSESFEGINGQVTFVIATGVNPRVFGQAGRKFVFRIIVHNLTGNNRTEKRTNFVISETRQQSRQSYLLQIPQGAVRIRIELQAFTEAGIQASNVFNQEFRGTPEEKDKPPTTTRPCNCRGVIKKVPINQPCPVCEEIPPEEAKPSLLGSIDGLVMASLIVGALIPLGSKKK